MSGFAMGMPDAPVRLHLFNDTVLENLMEYDVDEPGFCHNQPPSHVLVPTDEYLAFIAPKEAGPG